MPNTPVARKPPLPPAAPEATAARSSRSSTRIAPAAVPPAANRPVSDGLRPPTVPTRTRQLATPAPIPRDRASRVGTYLHGTEGLQGPGSEGPKLRLTQNKVVPGTRYKIVRWLGEGGMGVVYEAEHVDIERRVALKILRFDLSQQANMVQVFKEEAKAAGRLGSPYLVELFDFGELADGRLFFAMELLDGADLVPVDTASQTPAEVLLPFLRQVCKGLGVAHDAGVVHRDVKPENVITTTAPDGRTQIKIVDFGISAMLAVGPDERGVAGTPHYMAPEQILGQPFDGRLDIYALGCTAYELLTGAPPFDADAVEVLLQKQIDEAAIPPSEAKPGLGIPKALDSVVMRCLEKDPTKRYRDTADLEAALCEAQIAAGIRTEWDDLPLPTLATDPERHARILSQMPSPHRVVQKRSWLWPIVAGASLLAAVGLGLFLAFGFGPSQQQTDDVERLTVEAREAASRADWVVPPAPEAPTAFARVLDLEALPGAADALGDERGDELRTEFAGTLIKQGDELWDHGARDLARHYYFYSLLFDDSNAYALERSGTSPSLLATYAERARNGEFNDSDKILASLAAAEVEQDPAAKEEKLAAANQVLDEAEDESAIVLAQSDASAALLRKRRAKRSRAQDPERGAGTEEPKEATPEAAIPPDPVEEAVEVEPESAPTPKSGKGGGGRKAKKKIKFNTGVDLTGAARDPEKAAALASEGKAALRSGRRSEASRLFNQAISYDRKNGTALMGLSDIYFDTGQNSKAVIYAEKAVKASPANKSYRLKLGDAYFKVLRYKDALTQYEEAKKRGAKKADARISRVKAKLGG